MNNMVKIVLSLIILTCLIIPASAADIYEASLTTFRPDDIDDLENTSWSPFGTFTLLKGEAKTSIHRVEIIDISLDTETVFLEVTKGGTRYTRFVGISERVVIDQDFKVGLNWIRSAGGSIIGDDDTVVSIWIAPNSVDELGLSEGGVNRYNPIQYGTQDGWVSTTNEEKVVIYIHRNIASSGISVDIEGGEWDEISDSGDTDRSFELTENGKYTIIIEYTKQDVWGGESDESEVYQLEISGLAASTSSYSGYSGTSSSDSSTSYSNDNLGLLGSYSDVTHKYIIVTTSNDGQFAEDSSYVVKYDGQNANGDYVWKVKFSTPGTRKVNFESSAGTGYFEFTITDSSAVTTTVSSSQTTSDNDNGAAVILMIVGVVAILGVLAYSIMKKKSKGREGPADMSEIIP